MSSVLVDPADFGSAIDFDRIIHLIGLAEIVVVVEVDRIDLSLAAVAAVVEVDQTNSSAGLEVV